MNLKLQLQNMYKLCLVALFAISFVIFAPVEQPQAQGQNSMITNILCNAINQITGPVGRAISILIIISLAIALFIGKVSWGMAIAVAVGMGILFGAKDVVNLISGSSAAMCG